MTPVSAAPIVPTMLAFDSKGAPIWSFLADSIPSTTNAVPAIAVADGAGRVVVAGHRDVGNQPRTFLARFWM